MDCFVHPLKFNTNSKGERYPVNHYDCCGASRSRVDTIHYEASNPKGCHRIDHVSSMEELDRILRRPYACVLKSDKLDVMSTHSQAGIVYIGNEEHLSNTHIFEIPFDRSIHIETDLEYDSLLESIGLSDKSDYDRIASSSRFYTYSEEEYSQDIKKWNDYSRKDDFLPFYIVRRMDFRIDPEKRREIQARIRCSS